MIRFPQDKKKGKKEFLFIIHVDFEFFFLIVDCPLTDLLWDLLLSGKSERSASKWR